MHVHQTVLQCEACTGRYLQLRQRCLKKTWATQSPNKIVSQGVLPVCACFGAIHLILVLVGALQWDDFGRLYAGGMFQMRTATVEDFSLANAMMTEAIASGTCPCPRCARHHGLLVTFYFSLLPSKGRSPHCRVHWLSS